jgi:hypothetical protein
MLCRRDSFPPSSKEQWVLLALPVLQELVERRVAVQQELRVLLGLLVPAAELLALRVQQGLLVVLVPQEPQERV